MTGIAFSYLRFSTPEQAMGDSRRRQLSLAETNARQHSLVLDKGVNFRDLGVSASRGKNAREGGLRSFLDAVEHGLVPANSHLLVESLDRLSRDRILEAQTLFLQIVNAGVTIVTLIDQRTYSRASLNANPTDLIVSLVYMMRATRRARRNPSGFGRQWRPSGTTRHCATTACNARGGWWGAATEADTTWSRSGLPSCSASTVTRLPGWGCRRSPAC